MDDSLPLAACLPLSNTVVLEVASVNPSLSSASRPSDAPFSPNSTTAFDSSASLSERFRWSVVGTE
jgi:hypothetical protein